MNKVLGFIGIVLVMVSLPAWSEDTTNLPTTLRNGGFESPSIAVGAKTNAEPDAWFSFWSDNSRNIGITEAQKRSGMQSLFFKAQVPAESYEGSWQKFPVTPGSHYAFSVWVMNDPESPLTSEAYGRLSIEWKNAEGAEISRILGNSWNKNLTPANWQNFSVDGVAPTNATHGAAVVTFFGRDSAGIGGFFVDDAEWVVR